MKNLIKKTIVMLLIVCSLVSTVGVQPVQAHVKLPVIEPFDSYKLPASKVPKIEKVFCNQDALIIAFNPMFKTSVRKSYKIEIEKKIKGKWLRVFSVLSSVRTYNAGRELVSVPRFKFKSGDEVRIRLKYFNFKGTKDLTKWSKWYKIKIKKNTTINKRVKCNVKVDKHGILYVQADKCDGYLVEYCKNKKFKKKKPDKLNTAITGNTYEFGYVESEIWLPYVNVTSEAVYGNDFMDFKPTIHYGGYARVTPFELFSDGRIKYYPTSKIVKLVGK